MELPRVVLITDGSAYSTGSVGGWACILRFELGGQIIDRELSGQIPFATNNQAELLAVINGIEHLKRSCAVEVVSDSRYVVNGVNTWASQWEHKCWKTADHKPVKNASLWKHILELKKTHKVHATHVKGHNHHTDNERCDELANEARLGNANQ